jgi:hypothetical protein
MGNAFSLLGQMDVACEQRGRDFCCEQSGDTGDRGHNRICNLNMETCDNA